MPFPRQVLTIAALTLGLTAPMAVGQVEDGVTVDPRSPAGKEYALPVDQARRDAADGGKGGRASKGNAPTPAFGAGVRPDRETDRGEGPGSPNQGPSGRSGDSVSSPTRSTSSDRSSDLAPAGTPMERARERDDIDRALVKASVGGGGASDGSLVLLGGGVVVMVLGVAAGLALRRRAA